MCQVYNDYFHGIPIYIINHSKEGNRSKITVQIYLNDVEEGGETNFFDSNNNLVYSLKPKKGTVAFFDHTIMHEGAEVKKGVKYAFRVNAVYEKDKVNTFW